MAMTREEIAAKVEWEGGVYETICGYGMDSSVLPEDAPPNVRTCWEMVKAADAAVEVIENWLYPDPEEAA